MVYIENGDKFTVGHPFIDADHYELVRCINLLYDAVKSGVPVAEQSRLFGTLIERTKDHFQREEAFMKKIAFVGFGRHKAEHDMLLEEVVELHGRFSSGSVTLTDSLFDYLNEWLLFHAVTTDKKLAEAAVGVLVK